MIRLVPSCLESGDKVEGVAQQYCHPYEPDYKNAAILFESTMGSFYQESF